MALRWGIAGVSKIAHDFCIALRSNLTDIAHEVIAVGSRSKERATEFATRHAITVSYGTYLELAQDNNVEVVYITVLNTQHLEVAKLMLEHGKHIVCEKPFAMNATEAQEIVDLAAKQSLFVMEGIWSRFFPVYRHLKCSIDSHDLGDIREIYIKHGFFGTNSARITNKELGGGIVLDIGCYAIQLLLLVFQEEPKHIKAEGKLNANGVDLYFEAELTFSADRVGKITCSGLGALENQATIITTKGPICIPTYWCPTRYMALGAIHQWDIPDVSEELNYTNSVGLKYEADEVSKCIRAGKLYSDIMTPKDTLLIAKIQDDIRKQIGVSFE